MSSDKEYDAYIKGLEAGKEHNTPSKETIKLVKDLEIKMTDKIEDESKALVAKIDTKVSFKAFTWVLGIMMTIVLGVLGIIYSKVEDIDDKAETTQHSVSRIEGILSISEVE